MAVPPIKPMKAKRPPSKASKSKKSNSVQSFFRNHPWAQKLILALALAAVIGTTETNFHFLENIAANTVENFNYSELQIRDYAIESMRWMSNEDGTPMFEPQEAKALADKVAKIVMRTINNLNRGRRVARFSDIRDGIETGQSYVDEMIAEEAAKKLTTSTVVNNNTAEANKTI